MRISSSIGVFLRRAIVAMALVSIAKLAAQPIGRALVTNYSSDDVGFDATSWSAIQDQSGVLYFAADRLLSFDGERWREFPMGTGKTLRAVALEGNDRIWAGAINELGWYDRTAAGWEYHSLRDLVPAEHREFGNLWRIFIRGKEVFYIAQDRVLRWDGLKITVWPLPSPRPIRGLQVGNDIFVQENNSGLYILRDAGPELVVPGSVLDHAIITRLENHPEGGWLAVTNQGFRIITPEKSELWPCAANEYIQRWKPTDTIRLADGRLVISMQHGGLIVVRPDGSVAQLLSIPLGLASDEINGMFLARDDSLWLFGFDVITRLSLGGMLFLPPTASSANPYDLIVDHQDSLLVGTHDILYQLDPSGLRFNELTDPRGSLNALAASPAGVLVSSVEKVYRLENGRAEVIYRPERDTFATLSLPNGDFLVSERRGLTRVRGDDARRVVEELPDHAVSLAMDSRGMVWMGTENDGIALASIDAAPVRARSARELLGTLAKKGPGIVRGAHQGDIVALANRGWIVRDQAGAPRPVEIAGYPDAAIVDASEVAEDGSIWLLFRGSGPAKIQLGRVSTHSLQPRWEPHAVDGLERIGLPRALRAQRLADGSTNLWVVGGRGILRSPVIGQPASSRPHPPVLTALVTTENTGQYQRISAPLPYSTGMVLFEFAAPEFTRRASLHIETRVDGLDGDSDWITARPDSRQELSALRDGSYLFRVRVIDEFGQVSDETQFAFTVLPPWWRTQPALIGAVLGLAACGYGVYRRRVRTFREREVELENKVRERTEELEAANAAKTEFVANMSHDIRNPLNGIQGMALALEDTQLDPKQAHIVATLRECTTFLSSLVDDVLDFASIEAGKVELRPGPFAPGELLQSVVATLQGEIAEQGARVSIDVAPNLPERLMGDAGRIQQILVNYVSNALKYAGGHIRLSIARRVGAPGEMEFAVQDDGPGLSLAEQATLFTKFTRLSRDRASDVTGSGLGLASCRLLADLMGGSVGVTSQPEAGSRFLLRLPLTIATTAVDTPMVAALPNTSVLLVEDTDYNAIAATAVLARLGLTCERARTGAEALAMFRQKRFNLVLLDRNLPDMDGTEVARQVRAVESDGLQAMLLAVTAYCTAEDRQLCLDAGMDAFVGKPLTPEKLRRVLLTASRRLVGTAPVEVPPDLQATGTGFDLSMLTLLADDADSVDDQIDRYLDTLEDYERELNAAAAEHDRETLADAAHRMVSHARMIHAGALGDAAKSLEDAARAGNQPATTDLLQRTTREARATANALRQRRTAGTLA